jgi:hypothetical protein
MFTPLPVVVVAGVTAGLVILAGALAGPAPRCPGCSAPLPKLRAPASLGQLLWGGWTCPACGCAADRRGRKAAG